MNTKFGAIIIATLLLAVLATACGGSTPAPTPAQPQVQPTAAAVQPTVAPSPTPVPPTPVPPTTAPQAAAPTTAPSGQSGDLFSSALAQAQAATTYRLDMQMTAKGSFAVTAGETVTEPTSVDLPLFGLTGEAKGQDSHFKMTGFIAAFLGTEPDKGIEIISVGDKSYVHGPVQLLGANEDKWYEMPSDSASTVKPPLTSQTFLESFGGNGLNPSDLKKTGTETLDSQTCDVWTADESALEKAFKEIGQQTGGQEDNQVVDAGQFKFWVCRDGYLHQVLLSVDGHNKDKPDEKGSFIVSMHMYDINSPSIQIEAPTGAVPLEVPSFLNMGTPTP